MDKIVGTVQPAISVIMPVYNAEKYLKEAIESVLNQTYANFEFLIFDDGSTDNCANIIKSYTDRRIKPISSTINYGYVHQLNQGLKIAVGKYIARMDADDICHPLRFEKQVAFLEKNKDYGVCGTKVELIDADNKSLDYTINLFTKDEDLKTHLLYQSCFAHPTVMIRRSVLQELNLFYDPSYAPAEDYKMWQELSNHTKFFNIEEKLLKYRTHVSQTSSMDNNTQQTNGDKIRREQLTCLDIQFSHEELEDHRAIFFHNYHQNYSSIIQIKSWLMKLYRANQIKKLFPEKAFSHLLAYHWLQLCTTNAASIGSVLIPVYFTTPLSLFNKGLFLVRVKFVLKALFGKNI